jgi:CRISPR-associated protein Cas8a1/Csx13
MEVAIKTTNKLIYKLNEPGYTIYHRAALGGLAATLLSWDQPPEGIHFSVDEELVEISWDNTLSEKEALESILASSFRLTEDKLIDLPGQGIDRLDLRVAVHNSLTQTFLQHPKMRPGEKGTRQFTLSSADDEEAYIFSYKPITRYAHQSAQGTGLFDDKKNGVLPEICTIPQSVIPGAFTGAQALNASKEEVILLLFLIVSCPIFQLRPKSKETKAQSCVVVPNVVALKRFAKALRRLATAGASSPFKSNTMRGRVVGGAEEGALRFLLDLQIADALQEESVSGCQAIAMGKVAWDANQVNRSMSIRIGLDYPEIEVFRASNEKTNTTRLLRTKKKEGFIVPTNHIPELVATNLAHSRHWCTNFVSLMKEQEDFKQILFARKELMAMKTAIKNETDIAIINAFHDAWNHTMRQLYERAEHEHLGGGGAERLIEKAREKSRNDILRAKTSDMLAAWFLRFCANSTSGNSLSSIKKESEIIRQFIFEPRNFERFQNLCLFAMVSYESKSKKTTTVEE